MIEGCAAHTLQAQRPPSARSLSIPFQLIGLAFGLERFAASQFSEAFLQAALCLVRRALGLTFSLRASWSAFPSASSRSLPVTFLDFVA
jgi:hypothetical protein